MYYIMLLHEGTKVEMGIKKNSAKHKLSARKAIMIIVSLIIIILLVLIGIGYILICSVTTDEVPIFKQRSIAVAKPSPTPDPDVIAISSVPADITEDYYPPVLESAEQQHIYYQEPLNEEVINILIIGSDSRPYETNWGRSDTMMLLSYNVVHDEACLVSFLRDIWVPIEGHGYNRLNATYTFGGVGLAMNTINMFFDLDIQDYVIVDFEGMIKLVNKLGGIEVEITEVEANYYNNKFGWDIEEGLNYLNGEMTLIHARNRKSNGGDFERTRRQRDIMLAIYQKIKCNQNIEMVSDLLSFFLKHAKTNIKPQKLFSMAISSFGGNLKISQARIPADNMWSYGDKDGRSVILIDKDSNKEMLLEMLYVDE